MDDLSAPTMTLHLHAPLDPWSGGPLLDKLVQVTVNGTTYSARVTKQFVEGVNDELRHTELHLWMDPRASDGPTGPVLFTLDELGASVTAAEREAAQAAR